MSRLAGLAVLVVLLAEIGDAHAAPASVAVLGVSAVDAPDAMAKALGKALTDRVRSASGYRLVPGKDLDEIKLVFGCVEEKPACMAKAGKNLAASKLIWGTVKRSASGYKLTIKLLDVTRARIEKFVSENIGRRLRDENHAARVIERVTRTFLVSRSGTIKVSANVAGAQVMLGTRVVGLTDQGPVVLQDVPAGTHLIRVTKDGYTPWSQQVLIRGGETTDLRAELEPAGGGGDIVPPPPGDGVGGKDPKRGWKIAFWTGAAATVGLAIAMGVTGYTVLTLEEDKEDAINRYRANLDPPNPKAFSAGDICAAAGPNPNASEINQACEDGKARATATNVLIGVTVAAAALSGYFYYKAYIAEDEAPADIPPPTVEEEEFASGADRDEPAVRWMVAPSAGPGGGGLGVHLSF